MCAFVREEDPVAKPPPRERIGSEPSQIYSPALLNQFIAKIWMLSFGEERDDTFANKSGQASNKAVRKAARLPPDRCHKPLEQSGFLQRNGMVVRVEARGVGDKDFGFCARRD